MNCDILSKLLLPLLVSIFFHGVSSGQTLEKSILDHRDAIDAAKKKVVAEYQKAILEETKLGNVGQAEKIRKFSQRFATEGVLTDLDKHPMAATFREYGETIKAAGDQLRAAYLKEIENQTAQGQLEAANSLIAELNLHRLPGKLTSLQFQGSEGYLNHWGLKFRANQPTSAAERLNATFELTAGLSRSEFVSIKSTNWPGYYADHFGYRIRLAPQQDNTAWKRHATWIEVPGLSSQRGVSFKSVTHPDRYIRIRSNGEAWLDEFENTVQYKRQATFFKRDPLFRLW